jgi:hypothetical protein
VVYFLFIETRGSSLEEISLMIDGPEIQAKMVDDTEKAAAIAIDEKIEDTNKGATVVNNS